MPFPSEGAKMFVDRLLGIREEMNAGIARVWKEVEEVANANGVDPDEAWETITGASDAIFQTRELLADASESLEALTGDQLKAEDVRQRWTH